PPLPSTLPPRSFTTTLAPRAASASACWRPRPPPAPVTIATRPANLKLMSSPWFGVGMKGKARPAPRSHPAAARAAERGQRPQRRRDDLAVERAPPARVADLAPRGAP